MLLKKFLAMAMDAIINGAAAQLSRQPDADLRPRTMLSESALMRLRKSSLAPSADRHLCSASIECHCAQDIPFIN